VVAQILSILFPCESRKPKGFQKVPGNTPKNQLASKKPEIRTWKSEMCLMCGIRVVLRVQVGKCGNMCGG
jgi:hypothetical protein